MEEFNINQEKQPLVILSTLGNVSNGKSSLIRSLTGKNTMTHSKELKRNMTINLGYTNVKFYKCNSCKSPYCYQVNKETCNKCKRKNELKLHAAIVDCPGHSNLKETALSGSTNMDLCLLVLAADCDKDLISNDHYKTIKILKKEESTIIIHNKLDLISKDKAIENYEKIKELYNPKYIIPLCAQFGFGLEYLIKYIIESVPNPINDNLLNKIRMNLKASVIRSFDVNKPGTDITKVTGGVVGTVIKNGHLKIGDKIKIIPGLILSNGTNNPITAYVTSLKTDSTNLDIAYPGGLIGVGLSVDPFLTKEDRLCNNIIVKEDDENNKIFKTFTLSYEEYVDKIDIKKKEICNIMINSIKRKAKINLIDKINKTINILTQLPIAGEIGDSLIITKLGNVEVYGKIISYENL